MICATFRKTGRPDRFKIYLDHSFKYDEENITAFLTEYRIKAKVIDGQFSDNIYPEVISCEN